jgi:hypothetical protein
MIPIIIITLAVWKLLQIRVYRNLGKYFDIKEIILKKDLILGKVVEKDKENSNIESDLVITFVDILSAINNAYKHILPPLSVASE